MFRLRPRRTVTATCCHVFGTDHAGRRSHTAVQLAVGSRRFANAATPRCSISRYQPRARRATSADDRRCAARSGLIQAETVKSPSPTLHGVERGIVTASLLGTEVSAFAERASPRTGGLPMSSSRPRRRRAQAPPALFQPRGVGSGRRLSVRPGKYPPDRRRLWDGHRTSVALASSRRSPSRAARRRVPIQQQAVVVLRRRDRNAEAAVVGQFAERDLEVCFRTVSSVPVTSFGWDRGTQQQALGNACS